MADKNKVEEYYIRPEKLGAWAGCKQFFWNPNTSQFMGRTGSSWGKRSNPWIIVSWKRREWNWNREKKVWKKVALASWKVSTDFWRPSSILQTTEPLAVDVDKSIRLNLYISENYKVFSFQWRSSIFICRKRFSSSNVWEKLKRLSSKGRKLVEKIFLPGIFMNFQEIFWERRKQFPRKFMKTLI